MCEIVTAVQCSVTASVTCDYICDADNIHQAREELTREEWAVVDRALVIDPNYTLP